MTRKPAVVPFPSPPQQAQGRMGFNVASKRLDDGVARVTVEFPSPVSWIALEPEQARAFATSLVRYADEIAAYRDIPPALRRYYELIEGVTARFQMLQVTRELAEFLAWLAKRGVPSRVLEIGTAGGGTAALWCELGAKRVVSIDLPNGTFGGMPLEHVTARNEALAAAYPAFRGILADSHARQTLARTLSALELAGDQVNLLFIDGDHTAEGVRQDYEMYAPMVNRGGLIVFHDIKDTEAHRKVNCYVAQVWQSLKGQKREFMDPRVDWGGIGVLVKP